MAVTGAPTIDTGRGLLTAARYVPSPNQDARPPGATLDLVVVHAISLPPGRYGGDWVERLFTNRLPPDAHEYFATVAHLRVSAHVFIRRDGDLVQFVPFHARAWHAGSSAWCHRLACNDYSVGIELEGDDDTPYEDAQYESLAGVVLALRRAYGTLAPDAASGSRLAGHSDVAPGRKTDPGPLFDWARLHARLADA
jgi:AmpD protein